MTNLTQSTSTDALPLKWIEYLFEQMGLTYGRKFTDQWAGQDPDKLKAHWAKELAGYNRAELTKGYKALESRDWPPTLSEFKKMCRPPVDPAEAFYEAVSGVVDREHGEIGTWSHPAIFFAAQKIGAFDLKNQNYAQLKARWEKALHDELDKGQWPEIPVPMVALPAPGKAELSKEQAEKMIHELKAESVVKTQANDELRWAKRILERVRNGDKTVSMIQKKFAEEAMGVRK